jgi:hypothetical protein
MMINGRAHGPLPNTTACQLHMRTFKDDETIYLAKLGARVPGPPSFWEQPLLVFMEPKDAKIWRLSTNPWKVAGAARSIVSAIDKNVPKLASIGGQVLKPPGPQLRSNLLSPPVL